MIVRELQGGAEFLDLYWNGKELNDFAEGQLECWNRKQLGKSSHFMHFYLASVPDGRGRSGVLNPACECNLVTSLENIRNKK